MSEIKISFCQCCHKRCKLSVVIESGRIVNIKNAGCVKGKVAYHMLYHPDRIKYPLKRIGERGSGKWERITWDEALSIMAKKFGEIINNVGAQAIATIQSDYHKETSTAASFLFCYLLKTPNILDANLLCVVPAVVAELSTYGDCIQWEPKMDFLRSKCIIIWGSNRSASGPTHARDIIQAQKNGAKLIVVDPRPIPLAKRATHWLRVRPGADGALALGMIRVIIDEGLYDRDFVEKWCVGFEQLRDRVQKYSLSKVSEITCIPEEDIAAAARLLATNGPVCSHIRLGSGSQHIGATGASRAIAALRSIVGGLDIEGSNLLQYRGDIGGFKITHELANHFLRVSPEIEKKRIGAKEFPLVCGTPDTAPYIVTAHTPGCIDAMETGEIKAFFQMGSNIISAESNALRVWNALKKLDFLVVVDLFMVPSAEIADLVLPAAHFLECDIATVPAVTMGPDLFNYVLASAKVVEPVEECWDDAKIVLELAKKMNIKTRWDNIEKFNNWRLEDVGVTFRELKNMPGQMKSFPIKYKKYEERGFRTPSGKIELYSSHFESLGLDPLPSYSEPPESPINMPEIAKEYPLILITFRNLWYCHSEGRQIEALRKLEPEPVFDIHPETASSLGINDGEEAFLETPKLNYRVRGKAKFVKELDPRVIAFPMGWWFPELPGPEHGCFQSNINSIIFDGPPFEAECGHYQARAIPCRVGKD